MTFVIDASVTLTWCFKDEGDSYGTSVLQRLDDSQGLVPSIWPLEVANALLVGERRKRLSQNDTIRFISFLRELPISLDEDTPQRAFDHVLFLAREQNLSCYDAAYLELAMRRGCALVTLDEPLRQAAANSGVSVL